MSDGVRYWIIFTEGITDAGDQEMFGLAFCGKKILWEYLFELVEEEYFLRNIKFNGYIEISEQRFNEISQP